MITGININETKRYISKFDKDAANPTYFLLGCLDPVLAAHIEDESMTFEKSSPNPNDPVRSTVQEATKRLHILQFGLKGLENFMDPQIKQPVKFVTETFNIKGKSYDAAALSIIKMIPKDIREELVDRIISWNKFSEAEEKN